jgi:hypothetical protein
MRCCHLGHSSDHKPGLAKQRYCSADTMVSQGHTRNPVPLSGLQHSCIVAAAEPTSQSACPATLQAHAQSYLAAQNAMPSEPCHRRLVTCQKPAYELPALNAWHANAQDGHVPGPTHCNMLACNIVLSALALGPTVECSAIVITGTNMLPTSHSTPSTLRPAGADEGRLYTMTKCNKTGHGRDVDLAKGPALVTA